MPVPEGLENGVCKAEDESILDRFLGEIMVYSEYLFFLEMFMKDIVQFKSGFQVAPKRFFNNYSCPAVMLHR